MSTSTLHFAVDERRDFAELLDGLEPAQWEHATLCEQWCVREVVAHVLSYEELTAREAARRFAQGHFHPVRINGIGVAELADRSPAQLIDLMHASLFPRGLAAGFGGMVALVDGMIHQQDIRRPLGAPRTIPPQRLTAALNLSRFAPPVRTGWRGRGLRLVATDIGWRHGSGKEVRGPGEALLMALAARPAALRDLDGPGLPILAQRIAG